MATELERLLLSFEADTRKLRTAFADMESGLDKFERKADKSLSGAQKSFQVFEAKAVASLKNMAAAALAGIGLNEIQRQIGDITALQKTAVVAGVTAEKLQELRVAARAAGLENGELDSVMTKFAITMGEFRARTGDFYMFIRDQLPTLEAQFRQTKNQDEAFNLLADTVARLQSAEDKALITKMALSESSILLVNALNKGSAGFRASADAARDMGQVISEQGVANVAALNKELGQIGDAASAGIKQLIANWAPTFTSFLKTSREIFTEARRRYQEDMGKIALHGTPNTAFGAAAARAGGEAGRVMGESTIGAWKTTVEKPLAVLPKLPDWETSTFNTADIFEDLERRRADAVGATTEQIQREYTKEVEGFRLALQQKKINEEEFNAFRDAVSLATSSKISKLYEQETAALREQLDKVKDTIDSTLMKGLDDALRNGKVNFAALIQDMLINLTKLTIQAQITKPILDSIFKPGGAGAFMGSQSTIFDFLNGAGGAPATGWEASVIPAFAHGGNTPTNRPVLVGERRPELFVPHTAGRILPSVPSGGGSSNVINIDARGAEIGVEERLRAVMMEMQQSRGSAVQEVAMAQRRFPTRKAA